MPTEKPRFTVVLDHDLFEMINEYWHAHRLKNRNVAVNELLREALNDRKAIASDEQHFLNAYRNAPPLAQTMVLAALDAANADDPSLDDYLTKTLDEKITGPSSEDVSDSSG